MNDIELIGASIDDQDFIANARQDISVIKENAQKQLDRIDRRRGQNSE